jgi:hypothetical protein
MNMHAAGVRAVDFITTRVAAWITTEAVFGWRVHFRLKNFLCAEV